MDPSPRNLRGDSGGVQDGGMPLSFSCFGYEKSRLLRVYSTTDGILSFPYISRAIRAFAGYEISIVPVFLDVIGPAQGIHAKLKDLILGEDDRRMVSAHGTCFISPHIRFVFAESPMDDAYQISVSHLFGRYLEIFYVVR